MIFFCTTNVDLLVPLDNASAPSNNNKRIIVSIPPNIFKLNSFSCVGQVTN